MSRTRWNVVSFAVLVCCVGCDPQKAINKIFIDQGLTLLKPARSYIALGGVVVLPKHGRMQYLDPYDSMSAANGASTDFQAVIEKQVNATATGADVSAALGSLVALPIGFKFSNNSQVQLAQINASGTRYTTQMMASLVKQSATESAIRPLIDSGSRVFVIQELYSSTGMSVKSSNGLGLEASYGGAGSIPTCTVGNANPPTAPSGSGASSSDTQPKSQDSNSGKAKPATAAASPKPATAASTQTPSTGSSASPSMSVSVGVCRASSSELSFTSTNPIPFAVRLNEVYEASGNVLAIKMTDFKLPNNALGDESQVAATALVNKSDPTIDPVHIQHH